MNIEAILNRLEPAPIKDNEAITQKLLEGVAIAFYLTVPDLTNRRRDETTALARQVAMYLIRQETGYSLAQIGLILGDRTPATISWGYLKIAEAITKSSRLKRKVEEIKATLQSVGL